MAKRVSAQVEKLDAQKERIALTLEAVTGVMHLRNCSSRVATALDKGISKMLCRSSYSVSLWALTESAVLTIMMVTKIPHFLQTVRKHCEWSTKTQTIAIESAAKNIFTKAMERFDRALIDEDEQAIIDCLHIFSCLGPSSPQEHFAIR